MAELNSQLRPHRDSIGLEIAPHGGRLGVTPGSDAESMHGYETAVLSDDRLVASRGRWRRCLVRSISPGW
jgi:hypothetical protein